MYGVVLELSSAAKLFRLRFEASALQRFCDLKLWLKGFCAWSTRIWKCYLTQVVDERKRASKDEKWRDQHRHNIKCLCRSANRKVMFVTHKILRYLTALGIFTSYIPKSQKRRKEESKKHKKSVKNEVNHFAPKKVNLNLNSAYMRKCVEGKKTLCLAHIESCHLPIGYSFFLRSVHTMQTLRVRAVPNLNLLLLIYTAPFECVREMSERFVRVSFTYWAIQCNTKRNNTTHLTARTSHKNSVHRVSRLTSKKDLVRTRALMGNKKGSKKDKSGNKNIIKQRTEEEVAVIEKITQSMSISGEELDNSDNTSSLSDIPDSQRTLSRNNNPMTSLGNLGMDDNMDGIDPNKSSNFSPPGTSTPRVNPEATCKS